MNFEEFPILLVQAFYAFTRLLLLQMPWKKWKLKLLRKWSHTQVVIFWLHLEKIVSKLENIISGINTDPLWRWKSGVFLQSTGSKNLRTLPLNKAKSTKRSLQRERQKVITTFCSINCPFLFFLYCFISTMMMQYL